MPSFLHAEIPEKYAIVVKDVHRVLNAARINDNPALSDADRKALLTPIFRKWGFELVLVE